MVECIINVLAIVPVSLCFNYREVHAQVREVYLSEDWLERNGIEESKLKPMHLFSITNAIIDGDMDMGDSIPVELQIRMGLSRSPSPTASVCTRPVTLCTSRSGVSTSAGRGRLFDCGYDPHTRSFR